MLSTNYRIRVESICDKISKKESVDLSDMIWIEKLAKVNSTVAKFLRQARRMAINDMKPGGLDEFLNLMDLGDPDHRNHKTRFNGPDDIADFFHNDDDSMRRD